MKCFECGARCLTEYIYAYSDSTNSHEGKIVAVRKACGTCDWKSYPVKIPESI